MAARNDVAQKLYNPPSQWEGMFIELVVSQVIAPSGAKCLDIRPLAGRMKYTQTSLYKHSAPNSATFCASHQERR